MTKKSKGNYGEAFCQHYLRAAGYHIWGVNYRIGHKEADIVCLNNRTWVLVEVKTSRSWQREWITDQQVENYHELGMHLQEILDYPLRFDLFILVLGLGSDTSFRHELNAF